MSYALRHAKNAIDVMDWQERLDLLQYLAPKLAAPSVLPGTPLPVSEAGAIGQGPSALQVLTELRNHRDERSRFADVPDTNWAKLKELGKQMDGQTANATPLLSILTEMRE